MKNKRAKTKFNFSVLMLSTFTLCLPNISEAMIARSVLHDAAHIFSRSMRCIPIEPVISRSFSRYAKFDGEEHHTYITRAQELRVLDNKAWSKALELRSEYNNDWYAFQEKYFPEPKMTNNSHEIPAIQFPIPVEEALHNHQVTQAALWQVM
ncbi:MAG: hypothetical protein NWS47_03170 [Alphaproteobacteria bacterium]|nr:hypothetical protein [Alphaproteobacteria bacterium]